MRPLESLILGLNLLYLLWAASGRRPRWPGPPLAFAALLLLPLHWLLEGGRWQMAPAYLLTGLLAGAALLRWRRPVAPRTYRPGPIAGLFLWLISAFLPWALPVPRLPTPGGPYPVGTTRVFLVDLDRPESYSLEPDDRRSFMAQLWYPAEPEASGETAPYLDHMAVAAPILAGRLGLPSFLLSHLSLVRTSAIIDAAPHPDPGPLPVLVFSHGINSFRTQNTFQVEELASHGYLVASIDHAYGSLFTVFPDGRVVLYGGDRVLPAGDQAARNRLVTTWAGDIAYLLDQLALGHAGNGNGAIDWTGRLDLDRVGIFGHSTGAGAAIEFCGRDDRCRAGLGLDGWLQPVSPLILATGLRQPFMFINTEAWLGPANRALGLELYRHLQSDGYLLTVAGSDHRDFSDLASLSPLAPWLGLEVSRSGKLAQAVARDYTLAFFNHYLRQQSEPLLDGPGDGYPGLAWQRR